MAGNWTDKAQYGDWTYWGGDSTHGKGWYDVGDVQKWTPTNQWDPDKYKTYQGWRYDFGNGNYGVVDPNTGGSIATQWSLNANGGNNPTKQYLDPYSGKWVTSANGGAGQWDASKGPTGMSGLYWTPEMRQQFYDWNNTYGQGAAASKTTGAGNVTQYYGDPNAAYAAQQLAGNQAGTAAAHKASDATAGYGTPPGNLPGPLENYWGAIGSYFSQPGLYEQWAQQAMDGTNPYYNRLRADTSSRINQQAAARGGGNNGATLASLGNADAALTAQQFQDMGNMVQGAQNLALQRLLTGANIAGNTQGATQTRLGNYLSAGNGANGALAQAIMAAYGSGAGSNFSGDAISALANAIGLGAQGGLANAGAGGSLLGALAGYLFGGSGK